MRSLSLRLPPDSDVRSTIEQLGREQNEEGFILGVVGNLSRAAFQCPGRREPTVLQGNLEIITLNGTFSPSGVHLHLSLSDGDCQVWGGHLEPGTKVLKGADILVGFYNSGSTDKDSDLITKINNNPRIEIAIMKNCPWSNRALRILNSLDLPYKIINVDNDKSFHDCLERSNMNTFPQIFVDGDCIGGYDSLDKLNRAGKLKSFK